MAGLESIALAVLHLEREAENLKAASPAITEGSDESHDPIVPATQEDSVAFVPKRSGFSGPRLVSTDYSMASREQAALYPGTEPTTESMSMNQYPQAMTMPFNTSASTISNTTSPPLQDPPAQVRILETVVDMDLVDSTIKEAPPVPKLTDVIIRVLENDVLCGRGGETNHHAGNIQYRQLVKACQPSYIAAKRRDKPKIAEKIVRTVRKLGGRFLKKNPETNTWRDVGNGKAREKTSQALREGAPELRTGKEKRGSMTSTDSMPVMPAKRRILVPRAIEATVVQDTDLPAQPAPKKLKISVSDPASTEAGKISPLPQQYGAAVAKSSTLQVSSESPGGFTATISADDEDSRSVEKKSSRGPLLKLLKRRMESSTEATI
jgi:hypothetical protein